MPVPKDIIICFSDFLTLRFEGYNLEKFSCPYLSHFPNWQNIFTISVCIPIHSRLSWILFWRICLSITSKETQTSYIQAHSHTDTATQVERFYSSYWSNSDEAGSHNPTWINAFISYQKLGRGWTFLDFNHRLLSLYNRLILHQSYLQWKVQDWILEPSVCKKWIYGKSLRSSSLLQQKATILRMIHFLGRRGGISVLQCTDKEADLMRHSIPFPFKNL